MKAYNIQRIRGGLKFTCVQCPHSVSTVDFDPSLGNLRTQAATAINAHSTQSHQTPVVLSQAEGQFRSWR